MMIAGDEEPDIYIVGLATIVAGYEGLLFRYKLNRGITLGRALYEPAGVANRRAALAHPFSGTELAEFWMRVLANGHQSDLRPRFDLPANWRWPPIG